MLVRPLVTALVKPLVRSLVNSDGLPAWLQADLDLYGGLVFDPATLASGAVSDWVSREGLSHHAIQATPAAQPTKGATGVVFDGGDSVTRSAATNIAKFVRYNTVPDSTWGMSPSSVGKGFTCTGLTRVPNTSNFWIGNHGDQSAGHNNAGPWEPSLVLVSRDPLTGVMTKLDEIRLSPLIANVQSVQDITYDTSDNTLWFAIATGLATGVYHITTAGVLLGDTITATWAPNGLAYDPRDDGIWINREASSGAGLEKRSCATGAVTMAAINPGLSFADMLFFDTTTNELLLSYGANAPPGNVQVYNAGGLTSLVSSGTIALPAECLATEGIDRQGAVLLNLNDDWYHPAGSLLNQMVEVKCVPPLPMLITLSCPIIIPTTTGTDCVFEIGQPLNGNGFGLYPTSATGLNVFASTNAIGGGTSQQGSIVATGLPSMAVTPRVATVVFDVTNDLATLYIDGVSKATGSLAPLVGGLTTAQTLRIGTSQDLRVITGTITKPVIMICGPTDLTKLVAFQSA